jgi:hypothetical protein
MMKASELYFGTAAALALRDTIERALAGTLRKDNRAVVLKQLATELDRFAKAPPRPGGTDGQGNVIPDDRLWEAISAVAMELRPWDHKRHEHNLDVESAPAQRRQLLLDVMAMVFGLGGRDLLGVATKPTV